MYPLTPMRVYMLDRVGDDAACVARMARMLEAMGISEDEVVTITEDNLGDVVAELGALWPPDGRYADMLSGRRVSTAVSGDGFGTSTVSLAPGLDGGYNAGNVV